MAYNPSVNDRSGEIYANAATNAAAIQFEGMQQFGQSIGNAMQSLTDGMSKARENSIKYDTAAGMIDAYKQFGPQFGINAADIDAIAERNSKNPDALIASLAVLGRVADSNMSLQREQARMDGYKDLYDYKSANAPDATTNGPKLDAQYGREFYMGLRNNGRTHEQALQDMRNAGLNWAINDIERPQNQGFFNMPNPTGP